MLPHQRRLVAVAGCCFEEWLGYIHQQIEALTSDLEERHPGASSS
jgi:hypothetical protein